MSVIFSRACEYALTGLIEMARHPENELWRIQELAEMTNTPAPFLAKTFQLLVKGGILNSSKGRRGGFSFAHSPGKLSLLDIVEIVDGDTIAKECVLGFPECGDKNPCPFHEQWGPIRKRIIDTLGRKTLADLAR